MKLLFLSVFLIDNFSLYAVEGDVVCIAGNGTNTNHLTHTGLVFSEQSFWHRWSAYFAGIKDIPIQIASKSKFYKDKTKENKKEIEDLIHKNCEKIGGKILKNTVNDFTRFNISYAGICVRDKSVSSDPSIKYSLVHTKGRAVRTYEKESLKANLKMQCQNEYNGELILEPKDVNTYLDVSSYVAICKSKINM